MFVQKWVNSLVSVLVYMIGNFVLLSCLTVMVPPGKFSLVMSPLVVSDRLKVPSGFIGPCRDHCCRLNNLIRNRGA